MKSQVDAGELTERIRQEALRQRDARYPAPSAPSVASPSAPGVPFVPPPPETASPASFVAFAQLAHLPTMVERARQKSLVGSTVPKFLRPFYRNQGGYNAIVLDAIERLLETNRRLVEDNDRLHDQMVRQTSWMQAAAHGLISLDKRLAGLERQNEHDQSWMQNLQAHAEGQTAHSADLRRLLNEASERSRGQSDEHARMLRAMQTQADEQGAYAREVHGHLDELGKHVNRQIDEVQGYVEHFNRQTDEVRGHAERVNRQTDEVQAHADRLAAHLRNLQTQTDEQGAHVREVHGHLDDLGKHVNTLGAHVEQSSHRTDEVHEHFERRTDELRGHVERVNRQADEVQAHADRLAAHLRNLQVQTDEQAAYAREVHGHLDELGRHLDRAVADNHLETRVGDLVGRVARLDDRQHTDAAFLKTQLWLLQRGSSGVAPSQPVGSASHEATPAALAVPATDLDALYVAFENVFRGSRQDIKERLEIYLPPLRAAHVGAAERPVLDLGCGRGEWLELLKEHGVAAAGIDLNGCMVQECRERGLDATLANAVEHLASLPAGTLGAVTAFHLIEHLPFDVLVRFFRECRRVLQPGGIAIFETPNPNNIIIGAAQFYDDHTHQRPLPPNSTRFLVEQAGFAHADILPLHPRAVADKVHGDGTNEALVERFNELFYGPQDYAIIATVPA